MEQRKHLASGPSSNILENLLRAKRISIEGKLTSLNPNSPRIWIVLVALLAQNGRADLNDRMSAFGRCGKNCTFKRSMPSLEFTYE